MNNNLDNVPICEIATPKDQCEQIAKRTAKKCLENLQFDCDRYGIDLSCCLETFKREISKLYKKYEGD